MNHSDHPLDRVLTGLRHTAPPPGLESRVRVRLAQAQADCPPSTTLVRQPRLAAAFSLTLLVLTSLAIVLHERHSEHALNLPAATRGVSSRPSRLYAATGPTLPTEAKQRQRVAQPRGLCNPSPTPALCTGIAMAPAASDPDAIALAETLAPSKPTPPLPLTPQEALLLRSTRQGQPIELAELETRRTSALATLAAARVHTSVREYIQGLLGPLAIAQALTSSSSDDSNPPVADNHVPSAQ